MGNTESRKPGINLRVSNPPKKNGNGAEWENFGNIFFIPAEGRGTFYLKADVLQALAARQPILSVVDNVPEDALSQAGEAVRFSLLGICALPAILTWCAALLVERQADPVNSWILVEAWPWGATMGTLSGAVLGVDRCRMPAEARSQVRRRGGADRLDLPSRIRGAPPLPWGASC